MKTKITRKTKRNKTLLAVFIVLCAFIFACAAFLAAANIIMLLSTENKIYDNGTLDADGIADYDCVLVLGAGVREDGSPSNMLEDRLKTGIALYEKSGGRIKLLLSGDHGRVGYDEVGCMLDYAVKNGVPEEDIFLDHAGFSTYESVYRAKEIFGAEKLIIVTQRYHLTRAVYTAEKLGMEAVGEDAYLRSYRGQFMRDIREWAARTKDFILCVFKPEPTYLGEKISLDGDGRITRG